MTLTGTHLAAQSGELAEGNDQVVENITEAIMSCYHCTFSAKTITDDYASQSPTKANIYQFQTDTFQSIIQAESKKFSSRPTKLLWRVIYTIKAHLPSEGSVLWRLDNLEVEKKKISSKHVECNFFKENIIQIKKLLTEPL